MTSKDQKLRARIRGALTSDQSGTVTLLSSLLAVEDAIGYIPPEAVDEVAEYTGTSVNDVWGVASFYTNFRFVPPGEHVVEVCWGPTCHLLGAPTIAKEILDSLGLEAEGDTGDKLVTFKSTPCLGACSQGPVISVDHHLIGRVTPEIAQREVQELSNGRAGSA